MLELSEHEFETTIFKIPWALRDEVDFMQKQMGNITDR
jgi:hypothetical protein